jgi:hypothetical protein
MNVDLTEIEKSLVSRLLTAAQLIVKTGTASKANYVTIPVERIDTWAEQYGVDRETMIEIITEYFKPKDNYTLKKKGYCLDLNKIVDGCFYSYSEVTCVANDRNQARYILLDKIRYGDYKVYDDNLERTDITYWNIPVKRWKNSDIYEFEEQDLSLYKINQILEQRKRFAELDLILDDKSVKYCYIKKRGAYYRPDSNGCTSYITQAGVYTKEEAVSKAKSCDELVVLPIDVFEHNKMILAKIEDLKSNLIA